MLETKTVLWISLSKLVCCYLKNRGVKFSLNEWTFIFSVAVFILAERTAVILIHLKFVKVALIELYLLARPPKRVDRRSGNKCAGLNAFVWSEHCLGE